MYTSRHFLLRQSLLASKPRGAIATASSIHNKSLPRETPSQGHVIERVDDPTNAQSPQTAASWEGLENRKSAKSDPDFNPNPLDAASSSANRNATKPSDIDSAPSGNPEKIGFVEQVGGASASADPNAKQSARRTEGGDEEAQTPGVFSSVKKALGMETSSGDVKQNRGAGKGVTGTGTFSTSRLGEDDSKQTHPPSQSVSSQPKNDHQSESGPYRRSGANTDTGDYDNVTMEPDEAYEPPAPSREDKEKKLRYGNLKKKPDIV